MFGVGSHRKSEEKRVEDGRSEQEKAAPQTPKYQKMFRKHCFACKLNTFGKKNNEQGAKTITLMRLRAHQPTMKINAAPSRRPSLVY